MELIEKSAPPAASPFSALVGLFHAPEQVFAGLARRPASWIPVLAVAAANAGLLLWYFLWFVDYPWFQEQVLSGAAGLGAHEAAAPVPPALSRQAMGIMSGAGTALGLVGGYALGGLYFMMVGKLNNQGLGFGQGFSLSAWSSVPSVLLLPLGALQMLLAPDRRMPLEALNPGTLNQLLFRLAPDHRFAGLLESISIPLVWSLVLLVIGYRAWTGAPRAAALRIVLVPYAVIYGVWLLYALSQTV